MNAAVEPKAPGADCANCPGLKCRLVPPELAAPDAAGNRRTRLAIVGEGPGSLEVEERRPFVGPSGRMLLRGLRTIGLQRHQCHWTNAVLCDVPQRDLREAAKRCAGRLRLELAEAAPPVVMPVGAFGARAALLRTRPTPILKWRGSVSRVNYGVSTHEAARAQAKAGAASADCAKSAHESAPDRATCGAAAWVLPTIHPAFVMRSPQWASVLELDVERVGRVMRGGFTPPEDSPRRRIIIAQGEAALREGLEALEPASEIGFDVETVGLGPTHTALVCFGLSSEDTTVIVPWTKRRDGVEPWWAQPARVSRAVSALWARRIVITHNGPGFDHIVAARYALRIRDWDDTLLAAHALRPELPKRLSHVVTMGIDVGPWKELEDRTATLERLWIYNARDTLYMTMRWHQMKGDLQ